MKARHLIPMLPLIASSLFAQSDVNLPDPLLKPDGARVTTAAEWRDGQRAEVLELFREHVYGRSPGRPADLKFETVDEVSAMDGAAVRKRVRLTFSGPYGEGVINALMFLPADAEGPVPAFLLICHRDPENIDPERETKTGYWPAEQIVARGYAAVTFHTADVDPDRHDDFKNGVHGIFNNPAEPHPADAWGTIAAWAWGASRVMDYLVTDEDIDADRVAVIGHSRGGKTALWAGAEDERFALSISNESGCTGAALARRKQGERVADINKNFPHWFCGNYDRYNDNEDALPVDQHALIGLIAPRLAYVASAREDAWADPEGEFLASLHAGPVYELFDLRGVGTDTMPAVNEPVQSGSIGYHIREGGHGLTEYDWEQFMNFTDRHWRGRANPAE